jgi:hypothetical protein
VDSLDDAADDARKAAESFVRVVKGLTALRPAVAKLAKDLRPVDSAAREMDKVLSKKLELKIVGKKFGFSVRQILEGPGKVADFVLTPFDALADKALTPVLKKFKLQLALPASFARIPTQLTAAAGKAPGLNGPVKELEAALDSTFLADFQKTLVAVPQNVK